jgi:hypothetical protein
MGVKAHMDPCFTLISGWLIERLMRRDYGRPLGDDANGGRLVLFQHLFGACDENRDRLQTGQKVTGTRFEPDTSISKQKTESQYVSKQK